MIQKYIILTISCVICFTSTQLLARNFPSVTQKGQLISHPPKQTEIINPIPFEHNNYHLTPRYDFVLIGRVLGKERYYIGRETDLTRYDLAIGWKEMSDSDYLTPLDISQGNRFYRYMIPAGYKKRTISVNSANMHIIPSDEKVEDVLSDIEEGDMIALKGKLVNILHADGWHWNSSNTRNDTGGGACEIIWVTDLRIINDRYQ